jgi:hypothetical protein
VFAVKKEYNLGRASAEKIGGPRLQASIRLHSLARMAHLNMPVGQVIYVSQ